GLLAAIDNQPLISRELDDTKVQNEPVRLDKDRPQRSYTSGVPRQEEPSPTTEVIPETVISRDSSPLYYFNHTQSELHDGTMEVQAMLTWHLNPQLDNEALFTCEVKHPALSMPMKAE
ncbi:hypothetical protein M9458_046409, partial [Cirrhinus mrigala]